MRDTDTKEQIRKNMSESISEEKKGPLPESEDTEFLNAYFAPGIEPDDIAPFWALRQKSLTLRAFVTLFRGSETDVLLRLLVLSEMVSRVDPPWWGMGELRHAFGYLSVTALETVLKRLRDGGLISYDRETNSYSVTTPGQKVQSAVNLFLKNEEDEGIGMLTGLVYAGEVAGTLGKEEFEHLLYRLNQLEKEMITAVESMSEHRILKARERYESIWKYIEKGTDIIKKITGNTELDRASHKLAQQIGHAQSRLAKFTSIFQRALNDMDRQRIHLGNSGVSTSDLNRYLMNLDMNTLIELFDDVLGIPVMPPFLLSDIVADIAEYELIDRERQSPEDWALPEIVESPLTEEPFSEDLVQLETLHSEVSSIDGERSLAEVVPKRNYEESVYRLSMISLIGAKGEYGNSQVTGFINLPLRIDFNDGIEAVMREGVKNISKGTISRKGQ